MTSGTTGLDLADRRNAVRERYARAATMEDGCCGPSTCGPSDCAPPTAAIGGRATPAAGSATGAGGTATAAPTAAEQISCAVGYDEADLASAPEGANLGLGCGNPVAMASLAPGETVLDLGSGAGFDCFLASERVGPAGSIIGVDMTPEMLERARANAIAGGYTNVEFRLGEIEALPVADGTIDVVISNCVLNLSGERPRVLAEAMRVLRPGGRIMISDLVSERPVPDFVAASKESLVGCLPVLVREYEEDLVAAGFAEVSVVPRQRYPANVLADPQVQAVIRRDPAREREVRDFVDSIHGGTIGAVKPVR